MRKIIVAAVLGGGLLMSGCSGANPFTAEKLPDFSGGFSSSAELTYGKLTAQADIDRIEPGSWEFTFTAPEEPSGVVMTIEDGKLYFLFARNFLTDCDFLLRAMDSE